MCLPVLSVRVEHRALIGFCVRTVCLTAVSVGSEQRAALEWITDPLLP